MRLLLAGNTGVLASQVMLVAAYVAAGRQQEAEQQVRMVHQRFPSRSFQQFGSLLREL